MPDPQNPLPGDQPPGDSPPSGPPPISELPTGPPPTPAEPTEAGDAEHVSVRDVLSQRGFNVDQFPDDDQLLDHLVGQVQQAQQVPHLTRLAQQAQQMAPYMNDFYQFMDDRQRAAQPAAPAEPEPEPYWPAAPEWNPQWEQMLKVDQDQNSPTYGEIVSKSGARQDLVAKYHAHQDYEKERMAVLLRDPYAAIESKLAERDKTGEARTREIFSEMFGQQQQQQAANSNVLANEDWLYQRGPNGQALVDQQTGQPAFTQEGHVFYSLLQECAAMGISDQNHAWQAAMRMLPGTLAQMGLLRPAAGNGDQPGAQPGAQPQQPPISTLSPREQANQRFVAEALVPQPNRGQTVVSAAQPHGPTQNALRSFEQIAAEEAAQVGIDLNPRG